VWLIQTVKYQVVPLVDRKVDNRIHHEMHAAGV
jgi:uncharacterized membrane protein YjfL (UPF0719 family)